MRAADSDFADLQILVFIAASITLEGYPPTHMEICKRMGYAGVRAAQYRLDRIEGRGWIHRAPGLSRAIRLTTDGELAVTEFHEAMA